MRSAPPRCSELPAESVDAAQKPAAPSQWLESKNSLVHSGVRRCAALSAAEPQQHNHITHGHNSSGTSNYHLSFQETHRWPSSSSLSSSASCIRSLKEVTLGWLLWTKVSVIIISILSFVSFLIWLFEINNFQSNEIIKTTTKGKKSLILKYSKLLGGFSSWIHCKHINS